MADIPGMTKMPSYSEEEARRARYIVDRLLDPNKQYMDLGDSLVVSDIESEASEFAAELELLKGIGADVPAVQVGEEEFVPIALFLIVGSIWPFTPKLRESRNRRWLKHPFFFDWAHNYLREFLDDYTSFSTLSYISHEQARSTFLERATDFLATRLAAVNEFEGSRSQRWSSPSFLNIVQRAGGGRVRTPGCRFAVSTNSTGLRVFWSGAYRVSPQYFSHPTTPALGILQSGTYIFGADGGAYGNDVQWDFNAVVTLPGTPHIHLNY